MFQRLMSCVRDFFAPLPPEPLFQPRPIPPVWNNPEHLEDRWERRSAKTVRILGTAGEALRTIEEYEKVFPDYIERFKSPLTGQKFCWDTDDFRDALSRLHLNDVVGDTNDVGRLFGKLLRVGYIIERCPVSGLQKEILVGHHRSLTILRFEGRIISAYPGLILCITSAPGLTFT